MKRIFTNRQKTILRVLSGNFCNICKKVLNNNFHADHVRPFSKKGKTTLRNGQSLCMECNIRKGKDL